MISISQTGNTPHALRFPLRVLLTTNFLPKRGWEP
nr:MAG TPA: hypothetical protein [Caudoviricetes sp.]